MQRCQVARLQGFQPGLVAAGVQGQWMRSKELLPAALAGERDDIVVVLLQGGNLRVPLQREGRRLEGWGEHRLS